jgi:cysteine desulfurase family protein
MTQPIIYFDNAATTYPKPESVYAAVDQYVRHSANPGRGSHKMAMKSATALFESRLLLSELLGLSKPERLVFTPGCTYSINMALKGFPFKSGDVVLTGALEHNSVMRCLRQLELLKGIQVVTMPYAKKGIVDLHALIKAMLDRRPSLVVISEGSNVTGEMIDLRSLAAICNAHKVPLMVDAAQTVGRTKQELENLAISLWCASGHKGLFGPTGVGLLYVAENIELEPLIAGGTGSKSEDLNMPDFFPDRLEAGTVGGAAIAGLGAGARWVNETCIDVVRERELALTQRFLSWALSGGGIRVFGNRQDNNGTAVVAFEVDGVASDQVAHILDEEFNMAVRVGLHCAAAAHQTLGTLENGLVRVSFGFFNTEEEIDKLCHALYSISQRRDAGLLQAHGAS